MNSCTPTSLLTDASHLEAAPVMLWVMNEAREVVYLNPAWLSFTGLFNDESAANLWRTALHPDERENILSEFKEAFDVRQSFCREHRLHKNDGSFSWIRSQASPHFDRNAAFKGYVGCCLEIDELKNIRWEGKFLDQASELLASSLDYQTTLNQILELAIGEFGGWCVIHVRDEEGRIRTEAILHEDPRCIDLYHEFKRRFPTDPLAPHGPAAVIRTGEPEFFMEVPEKVIAANFTDPDALAQVRSLKILSSICIPLKARGRILGAMTFASSHRHFSNRDFALAAQVARRCALALDNARLYKEAQRANRLKDEFLAVLSHELRAPINVILGWTEILRMGDSNPETQKKGLEALKRNADIQVELLSDLLDISRVVTGKLEAHMGPVDLAQVVEAACEPLKQIAHKKSVQLTLSLEPGSGVMEGDAARLHQIVWNLLSNALKFTPPQGSVKVSLAREGEQVLLQVEDSGCGIEPSVLPKVFERFWQEDASRSRKYGGLGLGLAIVKQLVELHSGEVRAFSKGRGQGSVFEVRIPRKGAIASAAKPAPARQPVPEPKERQCSCFLKGLRILYVDDCPDSRTIVRLLLEHEGAQVVTAGSASEALECIDRAVPDLILSDIAMPGEDGIALIRKIRQRSPAKGGSLPAAAVTAYAREEECREFLAAGFNAHISKPIDPLLLGPQLARLTGRSA